MEYVDGESLAHRIRGEVRLDHATIAHILWQVADALTAAHQAGITHRDVKPSNILVTSAGQAKLSDFGIARAQADASLTQTGLVTGSPAYLAPEVASGTGASDASDVWSLGATLFHALSGHPPYDVSGNLIGGLYKIVHEEPPRLADAGAFAELLTATMARDPADRWSMEQVRDRLALIRHDPAAVGATSNQLLSSDAAPATEVLAAVPAASPGPGSRAHETAPVPSKLRSPLLWLGVVALVLVATVAALALNRGDEPTPPQAEPSSTAEPTPEATADPAAEKKAARATTRKDVTAFITNYLAAVTSDRRAAFAMLTPEFQAASDGFAGYNRFWKTIASASVSNVEVDPEALIVSYDVAYRTVNGSSTTPEPVTLQLQRVDDKYLIAGEG